MAANRPFDIVVFGASGYTGVQACKYLAKRAPPDTKIAIAARTRERLESIRSDLKVSWEIIIASYEVPSSIAEMVSQTRVIINCVGPYAYYGTTLPEACIRAQTDYLDFSGEPDYLERTHLEYHDRAAAGKTIIVGSVGIVSSPSDLGAWYAYQQLVKQGVKNVDSIESVLTLKYPPEGVALHRSTYESAIRGMSTIALLNEIRRKQNEKLSANAGNSKSVWSRINWSEPNQRFTYNSRLQKWAVPFPSGDESTLRRSFYEFSKDLNAERQPDVSVYFTVPRWIWAVIITIWSMFVFLLAQFSFTRKILLKHVHFFSWKCAKKDGPTEYDTKHSGFDVNVFVQGSTNKSGSSKKISSWVKVSGPDGYVFSPMCAVECAFILLTERPKLKFQGGVLTPALAFQGSSLIQNLNKAGITFEIVQ